jgi:hypothetical protein
MGHFVRAVQFVPVQTCSPDSEDPAVVGRASGLDRVDEHGQARPVGNSKDSCPNELPDKRVAVALRTVP